MSVMPAAAASSSAYWMSGLSTTGIISFGLALVTGRKRLPKPATGNTAFLSLAISAPQDLPQLRFIDHRHAEALRLFELGSGLGARDHIVGLLRHRRGHLVPARLERLARFLARHARERAGEDERSTARARLAWRRFDDDRLGQALDDRAVVRFVREFLDRLGELRADALQRHLARWLAALAALRIVLADRFLVSHELRPIGAEESLHRAEMAGEELRDLFADPRHGEGVDETRKLDFAGALDMREHVGRRFFAHALEIGERFRLEPVEVGGIRHQLALDQLIDELLAQALDVHRPAARKVQQRALALRLAIEAAGTARRRFAGDTHRRPAADRASARHPEALPGQPRPGLAHRHHLGNDVARAPDHHRVSYPYVLAAQLVLVMQRRAAYRDAADEHRLQLRHRRERAGAPDLHLDRLHLGDLFLWRVLVRDRPARLARHVAELALQTQVVHLVDDAVDVER